MLDKVVFKNSKGSNIRGVISDPGSEHIVLMCHGLGSNKDRPEFIRLEKTINSKGLATFRLDFFGHGESDGNYKYFTISEAASNIIKARKLLKKRGFKRIGFIGASIGGGAGIIAASKSEDFSFMVLVSPASNYKWRELFTKGFSIYKELRRFNKNKSKRKRLKIRFFRDYKKYDIYELASGIKCPVLIVNGDADIVVPIEKTRELKKRIKNSELKIFHNTDHRYTDAKAKERLIGITTDYIAKRKG